jgi:hypothetical protein
MKTLYNQVTNYIVFGKDKYHLQGEMQAWCDQNVGQGLWIGEQYPKDWTDMPDWTIHSMFGNTTFAFKDARNYTLFTLRWS